MCFLYGYISTTYLDTALVEQQSICHVELSLKCSKWSVPWNWRPWRLKLCALPCDYPHWNKSTSGALLLRWVNDYDMLLRTWSCPLTTLLVRKLGMQNFPPLLCNDIKQTKRWTSSKLWKAKFFILCELLYFWWGCRRIFNLITLGSERVRTPSHRM